VKHADRGVLRLVNPMRRFDVFVALGDVCVQGVILLLILSLAGGPSEP
jgi:hypothetical protein